MQLCFICTLNNYKSKSGQRQTVSVPAVSGSVQRCLYLSHTPVSGLSLHTCLIVPVSLLVPLRQCFPSGYFPLWTLLPFMSPLNPLAKGHCTKTALCNDWTEEERKDLIIVKHRDDVASHFMTILKKDQDQLLFWGYVQFKCIYFHRTAHPSSLPHALVRSFLPGML